MILPKEPKVPPFTYGQMYSIAQSGYMYASTFLLISSSARLSQPSLT